LGQQTVDYYLGKDIILSVKEEQELESILARLHNFEPIQWIITALQFPANVRGGNVHNGYLADSSPVRLPGQTISIRILLRRIHFGVQK